MTALTTIPTADLLTEIARRIDLAVPIAETESDERVTHDTLFDFEDGNGLVKAHRHVNPNPSIEGGWVSDTALVFGNAWVSDTARVYGNARVSGNALVSDNARVFGNAQVYDNAWVYEGHYT
jgi:UDP-3-O-[3-hydroxymyristoyl] glucosamine N-acyltransferase